MAMPTSERAVGFDYSALIDRDGFVVSVVPHNDMHPLRHGAEFVSYTLTEPERALLSTPIAGRYRRFGSGFIPALDGDNPEICIARAKATRSVFLERSDWTQLPDVPLSTKEAWSAYRQALRDITGQQGYPLNIVWPDPPGKS